MCRDWHLLSHCYRRYYQNRPRPGQAASSLSGHRPGSLYCFMWSLRKALEKVSSNVGLWRVRDRPAGPAVTQSQSRVPVYQGHRDGQHPRGHVEGSPAVRRGREGVSPVYLAFVQPHRQRWRWEVEGGCQKMFGTCSFTVYPLSNPPWVSARDLPSRWRTAKLIKHVTGREH